MTYHIQRPLPRGYIPMSDKLELQLDAGYFARPKKAISETQAKAAAFDCLLTQMSDAARAPIGRWQNADAEKAYVNGLKHWVLEGKRMVDKLMHGLEVE